MIPRDIESIEDEIDSMQNTNISKDVKYVWTDIDPEGNYGRPATENIMNTKPGPTLYAVSKTYCIESSVDLFMPFELINIVIEMTNIEGNVQMYM